MNGVAENIKNFELGPFSVGDLIALGGVVFMSGALWFQVGILQRELQDAKKVHRDDITMVQSRLQALEQVIPSNYVQRQEYREDLREIKSSLQRIESRLDGKVDKS